MKNALFYHIPRTGGLMISTKIWNHIGRESALTDRGTGVDYDGPYVSSHEPYASLQHRAEGRIQFTVLRDPVERVLSFVNLNVSQYRTSGLSLADYLVADNFTPSVKRGHRDRMVRQLGGDFYEDTMPIGEQFDRACEALTKMDWIGYMSELDETLPDFFDEIEVPFGDPEVINASKVKVEATPHALEIAHRITMWDQKLFEFAQTLK